MPTVTLKEKWETVSTDGSDMRRLRVPGGWLVKLLGWEGSPGDSLTFLPDPGHTWGRDPGAGGEE